MLEEKNDNLHRDADGLNEVSSPEIVPTDQEQAVNSIILSNAEESEDNTASESNYIPKLDYDSLSMEALSDELQKLISLEKITSIKDHAEELRKAFLSKYNDFIEEKKEAFLEQNPDSTTEFEYEFPLKNYFETLFNEYRDRKNAYYKQLQKNLNQNLDNRIAIIEELKTLIDDADNRNDAVKKLTALREKWNHAGPIPRDKYNHVWNNYHFHVERFYDQLHLDRESRDMDFKHNLEQKQKIITRVEELLLEDDIIKAFRELQTLHRIWKEEIGPVDREIREQIWEQFSDLTKQMHDKREQLFDKLREAENENLAKKIEIITEMDQISREEMTSHNAWQNQIKKIEALRNRFFAIGKVPSEKNEETWYLFKLATRNFNINKNTFYKDLKIDQQQNLTKKQALIESAHALKNSEDFDTTTPLMKRIQDEWKKTGHVPKKYSDSLWKEFKDACNHYFDKLHTAKNQENEEEAAAYNKKKEYLDLLKEFQLSGDHKTDLEEIKLHINNWKNIGRVAQSKRFVEGKFNKILDVLFDKLSLSKKETETVKFNNRMDQLVGSNDQKKIQNETIFIQRKMEELKSEIFQLENNIQFISNAKPDNPFVREVYKNIEKHKEDYKIWAEKLKRIKEL